ncbi:MAG: HEAT repeat domain-containing protein [Actinomycetales bacterium]|nr:HEAT repeat domain-containing protein [Actinomycetales bacterium]
MSTSPADRLASALRVADASQRLQAAMTAGTHPREEYVAVLVERCAAESDFSVREMLTWALTRHPAALTVPLVIAELASPLPQARSQALHTLSKIGEPGSAGAITPQLLHDEEDEVARTAWRAAAVLTGPEGRPALADELARELGRGDLELWRALCRAVVALGSAAEAALTRAAADPDPVVRRHARAARFLVANPEESFETALLEADRAATEEG